MQNREETVRSLSAECRRQHGPVLRTKGTPGERGQLACDRSGQGIFRHPQAVRPDRIYKGADGAFANAHRGSLVVDLSTVNPQTSQELSRLGSARGVGVLDVPISGGTPAAEQGALTLFGGGDQGCFAAAESIFRVIARRYFYLGPSGSGATMKLVVNSLLGIGMQAIAEAVALGEKAGLDRNRLLDVLSETAVVAPAHVGKLARAKKGDYSPQFPLRLMNKDFGLILNLAAAVRAQMPATHAAFEVNVAQSAQG
jgi:3-hydroxyisobutyrate dehydrogenase-like beta-hydroxyacid dehydrogenase